MRMERSVLVQVCSSGFVAFVSFQHITPDRLSQCLRCRGKGLGELIARSSQSPAQTTRYTSRSHTHTAALHVMRAMPSTASGPCSLCTPMARALNAWRRGAPSCPASCCGESAWAADTQTSTDVQTHSTPESLVRGVLPKRWRIGRSLAQCNRDISACLHALFPHQPPEQEQGRGEGG